MINRAELKTRAKAVMARSYVKMLAACALVSVISYFGAGVSVDKIKSISTANVSAFQVTVATMAVIGMSIIGILIAIFAINPLKVGLKKFMIENARHDADINILFEPFRKDYGNIVLVQFMRGLYVALWSLISIIPLIVLELAFGITGKIQILSESVLAGQKSAALPLAGILFLICVLMLIFSIPSVIKDLQYAMVPYLLAENSRLDWKTALSESKEIMVGNKWGYAKLCISFVPWFVVAYLSCCIGTFLLLPYPEATFAELYLELSGQNLTYQQY